MNEKIKIAIENFNKIGEKINKIKGEKITNIEYFALLLSARIILEETIEESKILLDGEKSNATKHVKKFFNNINILNWKEINEGMHFSSPPIKNRLKIFNQVINFCKEANKLYGSNIIYQLNIINNIKLENENWENIEIYNKYNKKVFYIKKRYSFINEDVLEGYFKDKKDKKVFLYIEKDILTYKNNYYIINNALKQKMKNINPIIPRIFINNVSLFHKSTEEWNDDINILQKEIIKEKNVCPFFYLTRNSYSKENFYIKQIIEIINKAETFSEAIIIMIILKNVSNIEEAIILNENRKGPKEYEFWTKNPKSYFFTFTENEFLEKIFSYTKWSNSERFWGKENEKFYLELLNKKKISLPLIGEVEERFIENNRFNKYFDEKKVVLFEDGEITTNFFYKIFLKREEFFKSNILFSDVEELFNKHFNKNELNKEQVEACKIIIKNKFSIMTGGAGTGKTFVIKEVAKFLAEQGEKSIIFAPTIKASQIIKIKNLKTKTIQKFLSEIKKGEDITKDFDNVFFDECSLIQDDAWNFIFDNLNEKKRVVFLGDFNQIPPINSLGLFEKIVSLNKDTIKLEKNMRTEKNKGLEKIIEDSKDGVFKKETLYDYIEKYNGELDFVEKIIGNKEFYFLTPSNFGFYGVDSLLNIINEEEREFKIGDKIRINKTNNKLSKIIYAGLEMEIEKIEDLEYKKNFYFKYDSINVSSKNIQEFSFNYGWSFDGINLKYEKSKEDEGFPFKLDIIENIYKSQGATIKKVCLIIPPNNKLDKKLIYTAVSRASEKLKILIYEEDLEKYIED